MLEAASILGALAIAAILFALFRKPRSAARVVDEIIDDRVRVLRNPEAPASATAGALMPAQVFQRLDELVFGRELPATEPEHPLMMEAVRKVFARPPTEASYAPRRPMLLPHLMRVLNNSENSRQEVVKIISQDPSLVVGVLKMANSPFYRPSREAIESLDRAVVVMGAEGVRSAAAAALMEPSFRARIRVFEQAPALIWEHTLLAAGGAEIHAQEIGHSDPVAAQLLGMLDGLGRICVLRVALELYAARPGLTPDAPAIALEMQAQGPHASRNIAIAWDLSPRILGALGAHASGAEMRQSDLTQSLRFGRLIGGLVMLQTRGLIDADRVRASLAANGASGAKVENILQRLLATPEAPRDGKVATPA